MRYVNTSSETRIWPGLIDAATGRTLQLGPGESADVAGTPTGPYLTPAKTKPAAKADSKPDGKPDEDKD